MKRLTHVTTVATLALLPGLAAALLFAAAPASAQVSAPAAAAVASDVIDATMPVIVKQVKPKDSLTEFKGTVMHANRAEITVRGRENVMLVRSFTLSPPLADAMQHVIDNGGYQHGDRVTVRYNATTGVAYQIKGKPSKPVKF